MEDELANISELAGRQHGIASAGQLRAAGMSRNQIAANVRQGWLRPVHRGVYGLGHRPLTWRARWMAAVLACGRDAALSHRAAGALWQLGPPATWPIDVTVPTAGGRSPREGLVIHRCGRLPAMSHHGIPVTTPARTLLDLVAVLPRRRLERAIDEAERLRLCRESDLMAILEAESGRPGTVALAAVLAEHRIGSILTRASSRNASWRCAARMTYRNEELLDYVPDFYWPRARLIVEVDGRQSHATRRASSAIARGTHG